jgi:hypothetical protein
MRRLVMWNLQTLDGCFEGITPWQLDFHMAAWGDELERLSIEQLGEVGTLLFGRATYLGMADYEHLHARAAPSGDGRLCPPSGRSGRGAPGHGLG